ncbi:MAG: 30S ribosomal protein S12 methylthiotransferase RimO [bacterium]|nr:30S ribosomal protein S12 methylthiotransferase RimO [bacterium]
MSSSAITSERVALIHLGCARNLIDSELLLGRMAEEELVVTDDPSVAHTVVLNTCSFIGPAREESYAAIRDLLALKEKGTIEGVVVAGCLVQRYKQALGERFPGVDVFAEISDYRALAKAVRGLVDGERPPGYLEGPGLRPPEREGARLLSTPGSYAYLRISHGCDHTCSFCAIPAIRGPHRSKRPAAVLEEAQELIGAGVRELVLVAEDSTAWGRDFDMELPQLVEALAELDGEHRLRVMYAYPNRFPWDLTRLLREHPRVTPYLDIPIQHASTPVLRAMRRAGSGDQVRRTLDRIREEVPDITLRTTLLVGFPGEEDAHFEELMQLVSEYRLARLGAFTYSPEQGTTGYELEGRVPADVAQARLDALLTLRDENLAAVQEGYVGGELEILVDELAGEGDLVVGRGPMDAPEVDPYVVAAAPGVGVGDTVHVRIDDVDDTFNLIASPVANPASNPRDPR